LCYIQLQRNTVTSRGPLDIDARAVNPLRTIDDVEYATMQWVDWYNNRRPHSQLD